MNQEQIWKELIDQVSLEVAKQFSTLDEKALNWKPNATTWSIAQILDHLIIIHKSYHPIIARLRDGSYQAGFIGRQPLITNFWYKTILRSVHPSTRKKIKTQAIWEPGQSDISADIVSVFLEDQNALKTWIEDVSDLIEKKAVIHSPAATFITYTVGQALDIITQHELRHLNQAKDILALSR